jgi:hypothetical protein
MRVYSLALLLCLAAPLASAETLSFSFSFSGPNYSVGGALTGTVTGTIVGLEDNATSSATAIYIDTADNNVGGDALPFNVLSGTGIEDNSFTVTGGEITAADLDVAPTGGDSSEPDFNILELDEESYNELGFNYGPIENAGGFSGVTYTPIAAAPEPMTAAYLAEGLIAAGLLGWRRLRVRTANCAA